MSKKLVSVVASALLVLTIPVYAQTATPVVPGLLTTSGCPSPNLTPCFQQNSSTNPLYTTAASGGGTQNVNVNQVGGNSVNTGVGTPGTGTQRTVESSATYASSSSLASNTVVCSAACSLTSFQVSADSTLSSAAYWIMIFDATSLPANGAVTPAKCYALPSGATGLSAGFPYPVAMTTGAVIGVSTTGCVTLTASVHAFLSGDKR